jgi:hypothetical protein
MTAPCPEDPRVALSEDARAKLAGLGYAEGGPGIDAHWAFACVDHPARVTDTAEACAECNSAPLLVRAPK